MKEDYEGGSKRKTKDEENEVARFCVRNPSGVLMLIGHQMSGRI